MALNYKVEITTLAGATKVADLFFTSLTIAEALNAPGAVTITVPLLHGDASADNLLVGAREVRVYRVVGNTSTRIWGGYLTAASADLRARTLNLQAEGYFSRLRKRIVTGDLVYKATEQLDIAWNLIAATQAQATLGITRGSATGSGVTRDKVYCTEDKTVVGDAITDLALADDGFDFWIDANKVWRTAHPRRGSTISAQALTLTTDNMTSVRMDADADQLVTSVIGYGETVNCVPSVTTVSSGSAISTYGLLHAAADISDSKNSTDSGARLDELLRLYKQPVVQLQATTTANPWATGYGIGDVIGTDIGVGWATTDASFRLLGYSHRVQGNHEETTLTLDSVIA